MDAIVGLLGSEWRTGAKRYTHKRKPFYVTGVSWVGAAADGQVKTFTWSEDKAKAILLRPKTAKALASYLKRCLKKPFITQ